MFARDLLGVHRVHVTDGNQDQFASTFHAVLVRDVTLGYLDYTTAVRVEVQTLPDDVLVIVPANGTSLITIGDERIQTSPIHAAVPRPGQAMTLECDADAAHLVVRIDRAAIDVHLSRLLGRSLAAPLEFCPAFDLSEPRCNRWNFAIQMLHSELYERSSLVHRGIGHGPLEEFLMSALLFSQDSNYFERLTPTAVTIRQTVRDACDYIERNLSTDITVKDVAGGVGVSVRTLQHQFSEDLKDTVTGYIKARRLERARAELADSTAGSGATVTEIASRWQFNHLGRFAITYRERFGESPSETLRH